IFLANAHEPPCKLMKGTAASMARKKTAGREFGSQPPHLGGVELVLGAIAFAAHAHRHQLRKDQRTHYASHAFRVCFTVRHVFGIDDNSVLAAAVLHDTLEDTTTDFDDLAESFGKEIADWVAQLSKDKRLVHDGRE